MGPCCHPTGINSCVCVEDADMHLTLRFLGSNTNFGVSLAAYLRHKTIKKPLWNHLPLGAILFSKFSGCRCHLGRRHVTRDLTKIPNTPPEATQEPLNSSATPPMSHAKQPSTLARSVQSRPPRTSQTSKMTHKSRWGTPPSLNFGANMDGFGPSYSATL